MADSFAKRQRERKKMQKQREKAARKREKAEQGGDAPAADGVTWYDLVGEEGGARPWDAGAAAEQGEDVEDMRKRLEAEAKAAERAAQERIAERERERRGGA